MANKYGKDSDIYRIRVLGDPPIADDETYIPLAWAQQCIGRDIGDFPDDPLYIGVDVARYGDDTSVVLPRRGNNILVWDEYRGMDTVDVAGFVSQTYTELEADGAAVDEIGIGAGVYDILLRRNLPGLHGVNVANKSSDADQYHRLRDEMWGMMREKCMKGLYRFPDEIIPGEQESYGDQLANELSQPHYSFDNNGAVQVESKKQMRLRGVASPNIADALGVSEVMYSVAHRVWTNSKAATKKKVERPWDKGRVTSRNSQMWMAQ